MIVIQVKKICKYFQTWLVCNLSRFLFQETICDEQRTATTVQWNSKFISLFCRCFLGREIFYWKALPSDFLKTKFHEFIGKVTIL